MLQYVKKPVASPFKIFRERLTTGQYLRLIKKNPLPASK